MGAFFLAANSNTGALQLENASHAISAIGLREPIDLNTTHFRLRYWRKRHSAEAPLYRRDDDNFCLHAGTLIYRNSRGAIAAAKLFKDFSHNRLDSEQLFGNFALLICQQGSLQLFSDALGIYPVWSDTTLTLCSSAMPALLKAIEDPRLNPDAIYPYVFQEATFGGDTPIDGLTRLKPGQGLKFGPSAETTTGLPIASVPTMTTQQASAYIHQRLQTQFKAISQCFGNQIDSALSGGYDSRLLLALCLEQGSTPNLHVYGSDDSPDVVVAKRICENEKLDLKHQNKAQRPKLSLEQFVATVENNANALQGFPCDGIIDNGADLATRHQRTAGGKLLLNGGGGEVLRNFFYLPNLSYTRRQLLWSFYSQFDPAVCSQAFDSERYYQLFEQQLSETLGHNGRLSRTDVEWLYPAFRCTYWMGQNNAINNQFGDFLTPLVDPSMVRAAQQVSIGDKNHGLFEAALIRLSSPSLATYPSDYGHDFSNGVPPKRKLKDWATLLRPTWLRRYTYRLKKRSRAHWPYYLNDSYIKALLPNGFTYMNRYFDIEKVNDAGQFKRICTLEYQLQRINASD